MSRFQKFQATCACGRTTTKTYIRANGKCKACVTGVAPAARSGRCGRSYDAIAREGGYEDTMGVSPDAIESYRSGGYDD